MHAAEYSFLLIPSRGKTPKRNKQTKEKMTTNLEQAEAQAFAAKQAAFRVYAEAVGTESEAAACQAYAIAFRDYVIALDAWMAGAKEGPLQAYLATEDADRDIARNWASEDAFNEAFAEYRTQSAKA